MKLEDLRNPSPDIQKAYSPNFSNTTNGSSDEKGAAELSEWILPFLKRLVPALVLPDATDTFYPDFFDFDRPTAQDSTPPPDGENPYGPNYYNDPNDMISPERPGGDRPVWAPNEIEFPPYHPSNLDFEIDSPLPPLPPRPPGRPPGQGSGSNNPQP